MLELLAFWFFLKDFPGGSDGKASAYNAGDRRHAFDLRIRKIPLEESMATHSSILAWRILWTEEPGRLLSMGLHRTQLKRLSSSSSSSMIRWVPAITVHYSTTTRKSKSSNQGICSFAFSLTGAICCAVLSHSVMSSCLPPHGL